MSISELTTEQVQAEIIGQTYTAIVAANHDWAGFWPVVEQRDGELVVTGIIDGSNNNDNTVLVDIENGRVTRVDDHANDAAMSITDAAQFGFDS